MENHLTVFLRPPLLPQLQETKQHFQDCPVLATLQEIKKGRGWVEGTKTQKERQDLQAIVLHGI